VAGAWSGNVVAYREGEIVGELGGLSSPHDLELARNGDIWLADAGNSRLLLLSPELEIKRELAQEKYGFNGVRYLDLSAEGILIAADKYSHAVKFIDADGELLHVLGDGKAGRGANRASKYEVASYGYPTPATTGWSSIDSLSNKPGQEVETWGSICIYSVMNRILARLRQVE
jgi:hypothetical protein